MFYIFTPEIPSTTGLDKPVVSHSHVYTVLMAEVLQAL